MVFKRRYRKKLGRRPRKVAKKRVYRKGRQFRKSALSVIRVKSLGLNTSHSNTYLSPNKMGVAMRKKYWLGAKNQYRLALADSVQANGTGIWGQNTFGVSAFNPGELNQVLTAFSLQPGATGTANNTNRIFWNKCIQDIVLTNSSNTNVEIEIFSFASKRDALETPTALWYKGMQDQAVSTANDLTLLYNATPLDSVSVTSTYKCYKITKLELQPGQSHKRRFTQHLCRPISNEVIDQSVEATNVTMRGITQYEVYVVRSVSLESGTNNALVGISPCKVNYYVTKRYEFKYLFDMDTTFKFASVPIEPTTGNAIYNQGSGASAAPAVI